MRRKWAGICLAAAGCLAIFAAYLIRKTAEPEATEAAEALDWQSPMKKDGCVLLRLANNQKPDHPASKACDYFAQLVEERTEGRIKIQVYHSAVLGSEAETVKEVEYGSIDMARVSIALLTGYNQELLALQMPYLYRDDDHMWQVLESSIGESYLSSMEERGIAGLCWYEAGARSFYTSSREIKNRSDLKDLRIRVQESAFMMDVVDSLGAISVDMPYENVREALKNGEIDGAENNFPSYVSAGHYLEAPYIILDEHVRIPEMVVMNLNVQKQLSMEEQAIIRQAARESSAEQRRLWEQFEKEQWIVLEKAGIQVVWPEDKEAFREKVQPIYDMYGQPYRQVLDLIRGM